MKYNYKDYGHPRFADFKPWPTATLSPGGTLLEEPSTLSFFKRINECLQVNGGYGIIHDAKFRALGSLPAYSHVRFFCPNTGDQYGALHMVGCETNALNAADIVRTAFVAIGYEVWNRRAIRPVRVCEETVLHVAVDADIVPFPPQPVQGPRAWVKSYQAELA